jgi:hypothetical protein
MKKYCMFIYDVYDNDDVELVWKKGKKYEITYENDNGYYFDRPISHGISKNDQNKLYVIIEGDFGEQ